MTTIQLAEAPTTSAAIQATQLPPQKRCRLVQYSLKAGATFKRDASAGLLSIQGISGLGSLSSGEKQASLQVGSISFLEAGKSSVVTAQTDLIILISEFLEPGTPC